MFPVLFAIPRSRLAGSQWAEMLDDGDQKIARVRVRFIWANALQRLCAAHRAQQHELNSPWPEVKDECDTDCSTDITVSHGRTGRTDRPRTCLMILCSTKAAHLRNPNGAVLNLLGLLPYHSLDSRRTTDFASTQTTNAKEQRSRALHLSHGASGS